MREMERLGHGDPMRTTEEAGRQYFELFEKVPAQVWYMGAVASLLGSALMFFTERRNWGFFLGQLAPTLLVLPLFYRILHPSRESASHRLREISERAREGMQRMGETMSEGRSRLGGEYGPERYTER